ncbi:MAG: molybdopterin-synthase adenylyltransferase MoeB [Euryarchaeota archaeon]|jgi:adenylyltransferase/sulfurtransferase|nr:molybdopterin-synthase adenylyltransferase MoeB [Euryarchaeota archaeon]
MSDLTAEERGRYARHLILPDVGIEGQQKLKSASICVIGAGGLGSPALLYLAAAGIGRIGIVDDDLVDLTNLQRQIIHSNAAIGEAKAESAARRITELNPEVDVEIHNCRLGIENALEILADYDIILDGVDNIPTRYIISDACEILGKPWVYGSIFRFEGQISLFNHLGGANYRDLFPNPPPPEAVPSCAEAGVLGVLPGVIGSIQATEALKVILEIGESLSNKLLIYDAKNLDFKTLKIGDLPAREPVTKLTLLEAYCEAKPDTVSEPRTIATENGELGSIQCDEYLTKREEGWTPFLLDIRNAMEAEIVTLPNTDARIDLMALMGRIHELPKDRDIVVYCRSGARSLSAAKAIKMAGFPNAVLNLTGGIHSWSDLVDSSVPKY